ncbi:MAG: nitroreductase family protein [Armatimonadetes bacterium]|nr:nitroreductase family protein [Armatimonadota bacterium]
MSFSDLVSERCSIRAFKSRALDKSAISQILQVTAKAPSAGNLQAYEVVLIQDSRRRQVLADAAWGQDFIAKAPVVLVFFADPKLSASRYGNRGIELYCLQDATVAAAYTQLAVTDLGLGSVWVGAFQDEAVREAVDAPKDLVPVCILPIGYPDESPRPTPRRSLRDLVKEEKFDG